MGNACSRGKTHENLHQDSSLISHRGTLTDPERHIIKTTWIDFISRGKVNGGIHYFVDFLRSHPEVGIHFGLPPNLKKQDCTYQALKHNQRLRRHVGKAFRQISEAVDCMDNMQLLSGQLATLGSAHDMFGVNLHYLKNGYPHLRYALNMHLNVCFSPKANQAWMIFYDQIMTLLIGDIQLVNQGYTGDWSRCKSVDNDKVESIV